MTKPESVRRTAPGALDRLRTRYEQLRERRIAAGRDLEHATKRLEALQREARDTYGTDEIDALRDKLAGMHAENARRVADYEAHLDEVESSVRAAEHEHREVTGGESDA